VYCVSRNPNGMTAKKKKSVLVLPSENPELLNRSVNT
jgi:hypothetical protein